MAYRRFRRRSHRLYSRHRDSLGDKAVFGMIQGWKAGVRAGQHLYGAGRFGAKVATLPFRVGRGIYRVFKR